jgi:hypothetical protein
MSGMNDYQNRLLDIIPVTLQPGESRAIPGEFDYLGIVSTTAGFEDFGALSITGAEFRRIPRGIYFRLQEATRNVWVQNQGAGVATFNVAVGLGDIRDSRFTLNGASVPVAPAPGACFPIELCAGLPALPVTVVNNAGVDAGPLIALTPNGGWLGIESSFTPGFVSILSPDVNNYTIIEGLDASVVGNGPGLFYNGVLRLGTRSPGFTRDLRLLSLPFYASDKINIQTTTQRRWVLDKGWDVYGEVAGAGSGLIPTGHFSFRYKRVPTLAGLNYLP